MNAETRNRAMETWSKLIRIASGEFLLDARDNSGAIIAARAVISSGIIFILALLAKVILEDRSETALSCKYVMDLMADNLTWFGAAFAAVYAALYTRFASQWTYLSTLYNQIKEASLDSESCPERLSEWKAGFIEDAEYLHLSHKENFVSIIYAWGKCDTVKQKFIEYTPGGQQRWNALMSRISIRYREVQRKYDGA